MELGPIKSQSKTEDPQQGKLMQLNNDVTQLGKVAVIGYGNFGKAIAMRLTSVGIQVVAGTRSTRRDLQTSNVEFASYQQAAQSASIVILAVPAKAYEDVVSSISAAALDEKIVIDVSNAEKQTDECNAERLAAMLPRAKVVKAFNTISAWSMENDVYGASRNTYICSERLDARQTVVQLAREMGLTPVEHGRLYAADFLEKKAIALFPEWRVAFWITVALLAFQIIYLHGRYLIFDDEPAKLVEKIFMKYPNRIMGWMALWLLAVVFLPGCIAGFLQLYRGTKYSTFPQRLDAWMKSRKQLGLFALLFAGMHACLSCIALAGEYYSGMSQVDEIKGSGLKLYHKYRWNAELSLLCATLSTTLMAILGLTSLPTVNQLMSWREWDFIQSKLGYLSMLFGFLHIFFYVYKSYADPYRRIIQQLPHHTFLMLLLPFIVMVLKAILMLPGVSGTLQKIRGGWERSPKGTAIA